MEIGRGIFGGAVRFGEITRFITGLHVFEHHVERRYLERPRLFPEQPRLFVDSAFWPPGPWSRTTSIRTRAASQHMPLMIFAELDSVS
jgi:hypothetical protein